MNNEYKLIDVSEESTSVEMFAIPSSRSLVIKWKGRNDLYLYTLTNESGVGYWIRLVLEFGYGKATNIIKKECAEPIKVLA